ncbi:MAG: DUF362 domain-containing protein [Deltaproteobacteria bacterium]|nr:DUF362 domain-containing protein [Deltaproteobacteria bacterium]
MNVYWIKGRSETCEKNLISKIDTLLSLEELASLVVPEISLAIKFNLSEMGYGHYLPPVIFSTLFEKTRSQGAKPLLTDGCSLYKGSRFDGYSWVDGALLQGFSSGETFHNQLLQSGGYTNEEGKFWPADGRHLAGIDIGSLLTDTGNLIVVSHITAHPLLGIAGALYNLGLGFLTASGKLKVHACLQIEYEAEKCDHCGICLSFCPTKAMAGEPGRVTFDPRVCNRCLGCFVSCPSRAIHIQPEGLPIFQECVIEAAQTVLSQLRGKAFFINFLSSVTPQPDEFPFSDIPFVPDLGIIASSDPVAVDWATTQMILRSPGIPGSIAQDLKVLDKGEDKIKAITGQTPEHLLAYAEQSGLGSRTFEFFSAG